ncbi:MAG: hypothetical protein ACRD0M_09435, partial [Acidimicrobiales bacterium]
MVADGAVAHGPGCAGGEPDERVGPGRRRRTERAEAFEDPAPARPSGPQEGGGTPYGARDRRLHAGPLACCAVVAWTR